MTNVNPAFYALDGVEVPCGIWRSADTLASMRRVLSILLCGVGFAGAQQPAAQPPQAFTLQQVLSAPFASELTAAPIGGRFAWVENAEGVRNLWVGGRNEAAHAITHYTADDGREIGGIAWSPDAKWIAYTLGTEEGADGGLANPAELQPLHATQLWVASTGTDGRLLPMPWGHSPLFTRDGANVLWVEDGKIQMQTAAFLVKGDGAFGPSQMVFDRGRASQLTLSPDGKVLAYVSTRSSNGRTHSFIAVFDLEKKTLRFVAPGTGVDSAPVWSPDGQHLAWLRAPFTDVAEFAAQKTSPNPWQLMVADTSSITASTDTETREARIVFQPEANKPGSVLPHMSTGEAKVWWAHCGQQIVFASEADGFVHLYGVDSAAALAKAKLLTPGRGDVEDVTLEAAGRWLYYASNIAFLRTRGFPDANASEQYANDEDHRHDTDQRHIWELDMCDADPSPRTATGFSIETQPAVGAGDDVALLASTFFLPMQPKLIGAYGLEPMKGAPAPPPAYPGSKLTMPVQVEFPGRAAATATHGHSALPPLHGQLFLPRGDTRDFSVDINDLQQSYQPILQGKHPAILYFHGGPARQMLLGYPAMEYYSNAYAFNQYMASRGFIVLSVNYRCGIGYGLDFRECEHAGAAGGSEYNDVLAAWQYLKSRGDVDMKHVGVWGGSYGGYLTALALARNSNLFAAGVDFHGVHEWALEDNAGDWLRGSAAEKARIAAIAHAASPMADVAKWRSPVLLIHGDDDPDVAYAQTPVLAEALRARGVDVEEMIFPDEVHDFLLHRDWLAAFERAAEFLERKLMPAPH